MAEYDSVGKNEIRYLENFTQKGLLLRYFEFKENFELLLFVIVNIIHFLEQWIHLL